MFKVIALVAIVWGVFPGGTRAQRQQRDPVENPASHSSHVAAPRLSAEFINRRIGTICSERSADPLGSVPIDEMQAKQSLPVNHPVVVEGLARAQKLLPTARTLAIESIKDLGTQYNTTPARINAAVRRIAAVVIVKPDMDLRDNASVYYENERTIRFGTIFLASLKSDEGMVSILAHELTHIGDGRSNVLQPLFKEVGYNASRSLGISIDGARPEELTCDLVGVMAAQKLIESRPDAVSIKRRISRSLEHNCVTHDDTDDVHLSPRNTMRAILALDSFLADATAPQQSEQ